MLGSPAEVIDAFGDLAWRLAVGGASEDGADAESFGSVHDQLLGRGIGVVAVGHLAREASSVLFQIGAGLRNPRGDHVALELGKGRQHVSQKAIVWCGIQVRLMNEAQFDASLFEFLQ